MALTPLQFLQTIDGGKTWTAELEHDGTEKTFDSFTFINSYTGFIVGKHQNGTHSIPMILRTDNGGKDWQESLINIGQPSTKADLRLNSISFCNAKSGWAVGTGLILHTDDSGVTWESQRTGIGKEVFFGISCISPEQAWAVGQDGIILHTENGGKTWIRQESGTTVPLLRIRSFGENVWIAGAKGALLHTRGKGQKWELQQLGITESLTDISFSNTQGWIVGSDGLILHTNDNGVTWERQNSPTNNTLISLFIIEGTQIWVGGEKRILLHLTE